MREKVTGIGKDIKELMDKNNITIDELARKTGISKKLLNDFIELKREPYVVPEGQKILPAVGLKTEEEFDQFIKKWIKLAKEKENEERSSKNSNT